MRKGMPFIMERMIAYCGFVCSSCPAFRAGRKEPVDGEGAVAVASETLGGHREPEGFVCDGCLSEGEHLMPYSVTCATRKCCREKGVCSCGVCDEPFCKKKINIYQFVPDAWMPVII